MPSLTLKPTSSILERITFETDLQISRNGTESRLARRLHPEYRVELDFEETGDYNANARQVLEGLVDVVFELPLHQFTVANGELLIAGLSSASERAYRQGEAITVASAAPAAYTHFAPVAPAKIIDTLAYTHQTNKHCSIKAAFRLAGFKETISPSLAPATANDFNLGAIPLFAFKHNFVSSIGAELQQDARALAGDGGGLVDFVRYTKKTCALDLTLASALEIAKLRAFLFTVKGRKGAFKFLDPISGSLKTYRFAADALEINYLSPTLATARVSKMT